MTRQRNISSGILEVPIYSEKIFVYRVSLKYRMCFIDIKFNDEKLYKVRKRLEEEIRILTYGNSDMG